MVGFVLCVLRMLSNFLSNISIVMMLLILMVLMLFSTLHHLQLFITASQWNIVLHFESHFISTHNAIVLLIFCVCDRLITYSYYHLVIWTFLDHILIRLKIIILSRLSPTCTTHIVLYEFMVGNFSNE